MSDFHLMYILELKHYDESGSILWETEEIIPNIVHRQGEEFVLQKMFNTSSSVVIPTNYYLGLDARIVLSDTDTLSSLIAEPTTNGYARQPVSSFNGFSVSLGPNNNYRAISNSVVFSATGGSWGPVRDLFLTNVSSGTSGYLISSAPLGSSRTVNSGQSLSARIAVSLGNCS